LKNLYDNLFHGPLFQGVRSLDTYGDRQVVGKVAVLTRKGLFADDAEPSFLLDPVTLDTAMHPLAAWHLEQPDQSGRIMLPFALDRVDFYQSCPAVGEQFVCRGLLRKETPRYVVQDLDVVNSEGKLCWRMSGIRLWRFYLPFDGVNFHGPKDIYYLSKEWPEAVAVDTNAPQAACVRLNMPDDLAQPAIQWAASKVILSPREQREFAALDGSDKETANWLFRRASCKDAVRKLFLKAMNKTMFVADIEVVASAGGWSTQPRDAFTDIRFPQVAVAHADGCFVAIAALDGTPGVAVASLSDTADDHANLLSDEERALSAHLDNEETEALLRLHCAKQAVANSLGAAAKADVVDELRVLDVARDGMVRVEYHDGKVESVTTASNEHVVVGSVVRRE
jgi:phosphopantetheinyl transferase (holo-ACP synthase)